LLVVDDHQDNLKIIGSMLENSGYDIILASSGDEALQRLAEGPISLILLDVLMPGRDGLEMCRHIHEHPQWADLPVIFLSAADDKDLIVRALDAGGADYVTKPFNQHELMSRVRTHLALKAARDQLKKLAEDKDELLGILAHDLKNHLGAMRMSVQLLEARAKTHADSRLERMATNIQAATIQTLDFVEEFLANSSVDRGIRLSIEPVSLGRASASAVEQYAEAARRKGIGLEYVGDSEASVAADRNALDQVLDNLISNAVKFSPSGRTVRVSVTTGRSGGPICRVEDEGPGFTDEDKAHMFRRYCRLSARPTDGEPSTGLGLSIVKKLVDDMGGQIRCESTYGHGAAFIFELPATNVSSRTP
jgi:two-component system sensor histidine kinase/response regulator